LQALSSMPSPLVGLRPVLVLRRRRPFMLQGRNRARRARQVLGSMLVYPNRMNFEIMPNGGQPPVPVGMLRIRVVDTDMSSGGLHIPLPHLHKVGGPWPTSMVWFLGPGVGHARPPARLYTSVQHVLHT